MQFVIPEEIRGHRHFDLQTRSGDGLHEGRYFNPGELVDEFMQVFSQSGEFDCLSDLLDC